MCKAQYGQHMRAFLKISPGASPKKTSDKAIDTFMTSYMSTLYLEGNDANVGDKLIAAWIYHYLEFGKRGHHLLPRVTKALKGWHRHYPARNRSPVPWIVIALIGTEMMRMNEPARAYWVMISLWCYLRPSEFMGLRKKVLVLPVTGVTLSWSLVIAPSEAGNLSTAR